MSQIIIKSTLLSMDYFTQHWRAIIVSSSLPLVRAVDPVSFRMVNFLLAGLLLIFLSPVLVIRAGIAKVRAGRMLTRVRIVGQYRKPFEQILFADISRGRSLPVLWNILRGEMSFVGPRALRVEEVRRVPSFGLVRFSARPGLFSFYNLRRRIGIAYKPETETDREFVYTETLSGNIALLVRSLPFMLLEHGHVVVTQKAKTVVGLSVTLRQQISFYAQLLGYLHSHYGVLIGKRLFDVLVSSTLIALLSPLFLTVALLIRLDSEGPLFFGQKRVGKYGRQFKMWKFRSMYADAEQRKAELLKNNEMKQGVTFKMKDDPRITRMGKFIRKFSIDELPQLWNVLVGDMSLVGPRPPVPFEVAQYTPYQRRRLEIAPGITCIWQVSGRSEIEFPQQVEMDLQYIATQSFWNDLVLLVKTIPAVLNGRGAY